MRLDTARPDPIGRDATDVEPVNQSITSPTLDTLFSARWRGSRKLALVDPLNKHASLDSPASA